MTHSAHIAALLLLACSAGCILDKENIGVTLTTSTGETGEAPVTTGDDPSVGETSATTGDDPTETSATTGDDLSPCAPGSLHPQEGPWTTVVDALPFGPALATLTVGGREFDGNFANRGDVEVLFDHDAPEITIEMRVHDFSDLVTFAGDGDQIPGTLQRTRLWAYNTPGTPNKPALMPPGDDCTTDAWKDGCQIRVYYDGKVMPVRMGADLRVHLPRSYRGRLVVVTEDNMSEQSYPRPADVTIVDLCSDADIEFAAGEARVKLCDDLTPAPTCSPAQISACESFTDDMGQDAAWSPDCPCPPDQYGQVKIHSRKPDAADITVDIPTTTWLNVTASNDSPNKPNNCKPVLESCAGDSVCTPVQNSEFSVSGEFNNPGPAAIADGGFNLTVSSANCGPVASYASPADWCAQLDPTEVERGHVRVCSDCL